MYYNCAAGWHGSTGEKLCVKVVEVDTVGDADTLAAGGRACDAAGHGSYPILPKTGSMNSIIYSLANNDAYDVVWLASVYDSANNQVLNARDNTVATFLPWAAGNPTDISTNQCINMLVSGGGNGMWDDISCSITPRTSSKVGVVCAVERVVPNVAECRTDVCKEQEAQREKWDRERERKEMEEKARMLKLQKELDMYDESNYGDRSSTGSKKGKRKSTKQKQRESKNRISLKERNSRSKNAHDAQEKVNKLGDPRDTITANLNFDGSSRWD